MNKNTIIKVKNKAQKKRKSFTQEAYKLMMNGVLIHDPERIDIRGELTCGKDVEIEKTHFRIGTKPSS